MKEGVIIVLALCFGIGFGAYIGVSYLGKGETVLAQCVLADVALETNALTQDQVIALNFNTGKEIGLRYPQFSDLYTIDKEFSQKASASSLCSQVLVALSDGVESVNE
jgi:hypothetical protein